MSERSPRKRLSFALYVAGAFVLTAAMTVLITAGAIVFAWNLGRGAIVNDEELFVILIVAGIIALVLSVFLGLYFAASFGQPIDKISKTAKKIKEGDLSARTNLRGDSDLEQLGENFDEMADAIERDRDLERQLIGDVAHELRTPLMAIQATVEAIQDGVFEADQEHMGTISSETRRLGRLVEALLRLNRLENGTTELKIETIDLSELVSGLAMSQEALIESSGLSLLTDIEDDIYIEGDRDLIHQAVVNLMSNAVRYTPEGGSISVELRRDNGYASVSVADTGVGIAEKDLKKVFSRFWRADTARSNSGGLGIGLALVREVVDQHRGTVSVDSTLGEGSTFTLNLPLSPLDPSMIDPADKRAQERRMKRAAKKELEKQRKEQDKLRRLQERQERERRKAAEHGKGLTGEWKVGPQQLTLFGIRVPLPSKKDNDESKR